MKLLYLFVPVSRYQLLSAGILKAEDFGGVYRRSKVVVLILAGQNAWHVSFS
jgi:hypothetical protein